MLTMQTLKIKYYLTDHPIIVNFRWGPTQTWFSTWSFLFFSLTSYILLSLFLHVTLSLLIPDRRGRRIPLGPFPALHSLLMSLTSTTIFAGTLLSASAEIKETRWLWHHAHLDTPLQWLLCFPLGTRPSGRVFFWSYLFYLSRFLHLIRTFFKILRGRRLTFFHVFHQSFLVFTSFLWLEFSQSFQVMAILLTSAFYAVVYGYRFWRALGFRRVRFPLVVNCQVVVLVCNLVCHVGVLVLHVVKGGCNGIGGGLYWAFDFACNGAIFLLFLKFYYVNVHLKKISGGRVVVGEDDSYSSHYNRSYHRYAAYDLQATMDGKVKDS